MLDPRCHALDAQVEIPSGFGARYLGVESAPLRTRLAALHAEALLYAEATAVPRPRVDGHVVRMDALVADFLRRGVHHFEVIRGGHPGIAVAPGHHQPPLRQLVVALELLVGDGPVDKRAASHGAVGAARPDFPWPDTGRGRGPMNRRAANRLADPGRQAGEVFRNAPGSGLRALIEPGQLAERFTWHLREARQRLALTRLQQDHLDATASQLMRQRALHQRPTR